MKLPKSSARKVFREPRRTSKIRSWYQGQLFNVCDQIDAIIREISGRYEPIVEAGMISARLNAYAGDLHDWAKGTADRMIKQAADADYAVWVKVANRLSRETRKLLKTAGVGSVYQALQSEEVELITSIPLEAAQKVHEWTKEGLARNDRPELIAKRIQDELYPITRNRAVCIARTETARARSNFTKARANAVGSTHYIWHTVGDSRTRPMHAELDGKTFAWTNAPVCDVGRGGQPLHAHPGCIFNCFPGETVVRVPDDLRKVIRAPFNGRVVDVRTAFGLVTATPNHPMLTQRGWVAASEIHEGDYLLKPLGDAVEMVEPDKDRGIARLDELFDALSLEVVRATGVHFDFYGDLPDGDVDTAIVKGSLSPDFVSKCRKRLSDFMLARPDAVVVGGGHDALDVRGSCLSGEVPALVEGHASHADDVGLRSATDGDVVLFKALIDRDAIDTERLGEGQNALAGLVSADDLSIVKFEPIRRNITELSLERVHAKRAETMRKVIGGDIDGDGCVLDCGTLLYKGFRVKDLCFRNFSGHVYTLETAKGWYGVTPLNFTAKNCRCWAEPLFDDES